ncbi:MAG TPA: hypothetical protein DCY13_09330 [Verrucomicrobiales bacterium]|nr:hypothetical protein [Verrucomicrobiales bacterium]
MHEERHRAIVLRVWFWTAGFTLIAAMYPVEYRLSRVGLVVGLVLLLAGSLWLWWGNRLMRFSVVGLMVAALILVALPGREADTEELRSAYANSLRGYAGTRYIWGGERSLGIDCSGLVRRGLINAQFRRGLLTMNGRLIRQALHLWWHDCSANALKDRHRDLTQTLFEQADIVSADHDRLQIGDLAVTRDGVHVLAYLGDHNWIQADPDLGRVLTVGLPTTNHWFHHPVVFMRWRTLAP